MNIAVVTSIPTPYRDPFWNEVAAHTHVDVHVFYCSAGKGDRPWTSNWPRQYRGEVLPGRNLLAWRGVDSSCYWNPAIRERLRRGHYDVVIVGGYNHPTMLVAMHYALRNGVPYFLMCESHLKSRRHWWRCAAKETIVRWAVRHAAGALPTGVLARDYLLSYGARPDTLTVIPNAPDVVRISEEVMHRRALRQVSRERHGLGKGAMVLFVGRLIAKKHVDTLIRALAAFSVPDTTQLAIVGDGPLRVHLESLTNRLGLTNRVHFIGFRQPTELPAWYAMADLFVLPSSETWGVVALEALAAGLPVIVSDEAGCHADIATDPRIATVFRARDHIALADAITHRVHQMISERTVRRVWKPVFNSVKYDALALRLLSALRKRVNSPGRSFG